MNTDQFQPGPPWFNRSYPATLAATASPQRELLRQLIEGDLPEFELFDLDTDPWCAYNLAAAKIPPAETDGTSFLPLLQGKPWQRDQPMFFQHADSPHYSPQGDRGSGNRYQPSEMPPKPSDP